MCKYERYFEEFKQLCPYKAAEVESWYVSDDMEITMIMHDGTLCQYDAILQGTRYASNIDDLIAKRKPVTEDGWRREFSIQLYRKMLKQNMTQDELSSISGVSAGSISLYLNGRSNPSAYNIIRLAKALDCSETELAKLLCY